MEYFKFLFYHIHCWQRRMDPYNDVVHSVYAFSALMIAWIFGGGMLICQLIDIVFGGSCLSKINEGTLVTICIIISLMTLIIPYSILLYKRNYFKLLLSMHRLYKDEYPDYIPEILLKTFVLLFLNALIYSIRQEYFGLP